MSNKQLVTYNNMKFITDDDQLVGICTAFSQSSYRIDTQQTYNTINSTHQTIDVSGFPSSLSMPMPAVLSNYLSPPEFLL